ncbi:MAG: hypothetical protein ACI4WH_01390 [Oscillospiraceae bacterium]
MNDKIVRLVIMVFFMCCALISCTQKLPVIKDSVSIGETQTIATISTYSYYRVTSTEGIVYEIPTDWKTSQRDGNTYHYSNGENYLMVSNVSTEYSQDTDMILTDNCASTLLENFNQYKGFLLQTDCTGDIDGAYCRKLVCSYLDENENTITERTTIFTVNGTVYSFDCISLESSSNCDEIFRRITGSVIISPKS